MAPVYIVQNPFSLSFCFIIFIPVAYVLTRDLLGLAVPVSLLLLFADGLYTLITDPEQVGKFLDQLVIPGGFSELLNRVKERTFQLLGPNLTSILGRDIFHSIAEEWYIHVLLQLLLIPVLALMSTIIPAVLLFYSLGYTVILQNTYPDITDPASADEMASTYWLYQILSFASKVLIIIFGLDVVELLVLFFGVSSFFKTEGG